VPGSSVSAGTLSRGYGGVRVKEGVKGGVALGVEVVFIGNCTVEEPCALSASRVGDNCGFIIVSGVASELAIPSGIKGVGNVGNSSLFTSLPNFFTTQDHRESLLKRSPLVRERASTKGRTNDTI
jgi:hypothetical protein